MGPRGNTSSFSTTRGWTEVRTKPRAAAPSAQRCGGAKTTSKFRGSHQAIRTASRDHNPPDISRDSTGRGSASTCGATSNMDAIELSEASADTTQERGLPSSLPPTDGGKDAWLVLTGCTILEALVWGESRSTKQHNKDRPAHLHRQLLGFPFAFGVFQEHYSRQEQFKDHVASLPAIGTTATVRPRRPASPTIVSDH